MCAEPDVVTSCPTCDVYESEGGQGREEGGMVRKGKGGGE